MRKAKKMSKWRLSLAAIALVGPAIKNTKCWETGWLILLKFISVDDAIQEFSLA